MTMYTGLTMYTRLEDGSLKLIPAEDVAVLDRYRDATTAVKEEDAAVFERYPTMPLVYEPQFLGDPFPLYPLIDDIDDKGAYTCYPMPGTIQTTTDGRHVIVIGPCLDETIGR